MNLPKSLGLGTSVERAPQRITSRQSVSAKMWCSGKAAMLLVLLTSPTRRGAGVSPASACKIAATMLRCVSTAPVDSQVVPPVYCKKAIESKLLGAGLSIWRNPSAMARLKGVTVRPWLKGSLYAGTIFAR